MTYILDISTSSRKTTSVNCLMAILKQIRTSITAILVTATLMISSVATLNLQQASAFGFVERQQIEDFQKLTAQFEKAVIGSVNPPEPDKIGKFRQLTGQWQSDVINAVLQNPPDGDKITQICIAYMLTKSWKYSLVDQIPYRDYLVHIAKV